MTPLAGRRNDEFLASFFVFFYIRRRLIQSLTFPFPKNPHRLVFRQAQELGLAVFALATVATVKTVVNAKTAKFCNPNF